MSTPTESVSVLIVDDEPNVLQTLSMSVEAMGHSVHACGGPLDALELVRSADVEIDIALIDLKMRPIDGIDLMRRLQLFLPGVTCVIITAHGSVKSAVEAIKKGAYDYLQKPFDFEQLKSFLERTVRYHLTKTSQDGERHADTPDSPIVSNNARMLELIALAQRIAASPLTVLIEGESGTGKELFAALIHRESERSTGPLVRVNCSALPENLLESELFGHVKGAFTGADRDRQGRFERADGGTLFLDEVGELPPALQPKLLRAIQEKEFERVGESSPRSVDVRIIAATNKDLEKAVTDGSFRKDLYYRLNPVRIKLPPLRERIEDIPLLAGHFLNRFAPPERAGLAIAPEVIAAFETYDWPGNVRELENVVTRAIYLARGPSIELDDLPEDFRSMEPDPLDNRASGSASITLEDVEREHIKRVIEETESFEEAARLLNIDTATLWRKRKKYDL